MKLHFYVRFHTDFGQTLSVLGNIPALGQDKPADALLMNYFNNDYWQLSIDIDPLQVSAYSLQIHTDLSRRLPGNRMGR